MAFSFSVTNSIPLGGSEVGLLLITGTCTNTAGSTGGVLGFAAQGMVEILEGAYGFNNVTGAASPEIRVVKSYDGTTYESDILTITTTADDDFTFWVMGKNAGV